MIRWLMVISQTGLGLPRLKDRKGSAQVGLTQDWISDKGETEMGRFFSDVVEYPVSNVTVHVVEQVVKQYMDIYHDVDGIFTEDVAAYACLQNARRLNIEVPRDLKIVGYDGNDLLKLSQPKITTIRQDVGKIASTCIAVMMERIVGNKVEKEYFVPIMVEKGGTTK